MIYVVTSHDGFVQWTVDHRGKDAIHIGSAQTAQGQRPGLKDEIHFGRDGDREAYEILCAARRSARS